jgi:glycyl-tRNA synthetase
MEDKGEIVLRNGDKELKIAKGVVTFEPSEKNVVEEKYIPSVIEPSFGIGRIVYCIFEHCFKVREADQARTYFAFPPLIAPLKCSILPLMSNPEMNKVVQDISKNTKDYNMCYRVTID